MTYSLVTYLSASSTTVGLSSVCFTNFWLSFFYRLKCQDQTHIDQTKHCHWNFCRVSLDQVLLQLFQTNIKRLFGRSQPAISRFAAGSNNSSSRVIAGYNPSSRVIAGYNSRSRLISYSKTPPQSGVFRTRRRRQVPHRAHSGNVLLRTQRQYQH